MLSEDCFDKSETKMALTKASTLTYSVISVWADGLEKNDIETQFHNIPYCAKNEKRPRT